MEIKCEITPSAADLQAAYILYLKKYGGIDLYIQAAIFISVGSLVWYYGYDSFLSVFTGFWLIMIGVWRIYQKHQLGKGSAKSSPRLLWTETVTFTDESIHMFNKYEDKTIRWEIFTDTVVTEETILLLVDRTMFYHYHRHQFSDSEFAELSLKARQFVKRKYRD